MPCWYPEKFQETHSILVTVKIALIERGCKKADQLPYFYKGMEREWGKECVSLQSTLSG